MPNKPILVFPRGANADRTKGTPNPPQSLEQPKEVQEKALARRWEELDELLRSAHLSSDPSDSISEMILIFEVRGTLDGFFSAVRQTEELQFLSEDFDFLQVDAQTLLLEDREDPQYPTETRIFITMDNEASLTRIIDLWRVYVRGDKFEYGLRKYTVLFGLLKDIRRYGIEDRLRDTGYATYLSDLQEMGETHAKLEVELVFKTKKRRPKKELVEEYDESANIDVYNRIREIIVRSGGVVIEGSRICLPEIHYHALIAEVPLDIFEDLSESTDVELLKATQVLHFRPLGQSVWKGVVDDQISSNVNASEISDIGPEGPINEEPIVALFDGLPLQNHAVLAGRLIVDDVNEIESSYPAAHRFHGTAMATLITRGNLDEYDAKPLRNKVYVRPIMHAKVYGSGEFIEELPGDRLPIDIIHQAVRRLFVDSPEANAVAPRVKIINLSIGDSYRPFNYNMSAWARLLDWLSNEYNIIFIISAGNHAEDLLLNTPNSAFDALDDTAKQNLVLGHIVSDNINRKILTPSESINSITVGASQDDASTGIWHHSRLALIKDKGFASPVSRIGFGYRGSIKPDILMPGGRKCYRKSMIQNDTSKTLLALENSRFSPVPPGIRVAVPLPAGSLNNSAYQWGTSNAAALTTRLAAQLHETLEELNRENQAEDLIPEEYFSVLIKALLVHGASWSDGYQELADIVRSTRGVPVNFVKKHVTPYIGYGAVNSQRVLYCTETRVTLLGWGSLKKDKAHIFTFPLPTALESRRIEKKIVVTLAWISPVNWQTHRYRKAKLFFDNLELQDAPGNEKIDLQRDGIDWRTSQRGTIQHDILIGEEAEVYVNGGNLVIKVNCKEDASGLGSEAVRYGIAVTFEVDEAMGIPIYDEIKQRLSIQPRIKP